MCSFSSDQRAELCRQAPICTQQNLKQSESKSSADLGGGRNLSTMEQTAEWVLCCNLRSLPMTDAAAGPRISLLMLGPPTLVAVHFFFLLTAETAEASSTCDINGHLSRLPLHKINSMRGWQSAGFTQHPALHI